MSVRVAILKARLESDSRNFNIGMNQASEALSGFANEVALVGGVLTLALTKPIESIVKLALSFDDLMFKSTQAFTAMTGSTKEALRFLKDLQMFAVTTPFEFGELITDAQRMKAMGIEMKDVLPILQAVGNQLALLGKDSETLSRVTYALGEILAQGKVMATEMRQLANAGIPAWEMLAKRAGKTVAEMRELSKKGMIDAKWAVQALAYEMQERAPNAMKAMNASLQTGLSNIQDAARITLGNLFDPLYKSVTKALQKLSQVMLGMSAIMKGWSDETKNKIIAVIAAVAAFGPVMLIIAALIKIFILAASPVGVLALAFVGLAYQLIINKQFAQELGAWILENLIPIFRTLQATLLLVALVGVARLVSTLMVLWTATAGVRAITLSWLAVQAFHAILFYEANVIHLVLALGQLRVALIMARGYAIHFAGVLGTTALSAVSSLGTAIITMVGTAGKSLIWFFANLGPLAAKGALGLVYGVGWVLGALQGIAIVAGQALLSLGRLAFTPLLKAATLLGTGIMWLVETITLAIGLMNKGLYAAIVRAITGFLTLAASVIVAKTVIILDFVGTACSAAITGLVTLIYWLTVGATSFVVLAAKSVIARGALYLFAVANLGVGASLQFIFVSAWRAIAGLVALGVAALNPIPKIMLLIKWLALFRIASVTTAITAARAWLAVFLPGIWAAIAGAATAFAAFVVAAAPVIIGVLAIAAVVALFVVAWKQNWFHVQEFFKTVANFITEKLRGIVEWIDKVTHASVVLGKISGAIKEVASVYKEGGAALWNQGVDAVSNMLGMPEIPNFDMKKILADAQKEYDKLAKGLKVPKIEIPGAMPNADGTDKAAARAAKKLANAYAEALQGLNEDIAKMEMPLQDWGKNFVRGSKQAEVAFDLIRGKLKGVSIAEQVVMMNRARRWDQLKQFTTLEEQYAKTQEDITTSLTLGARATSYQTMVYENLKIRGSDAFKTLAGWMQEVIKKKMELAEKGKLKSQINDVMGGMMDQVDLSKMSEFQRSLIQFVGGIQRWRELGDDVTKLSSGLTSAQDNAARFYNTFMESEAINAFDKKIRETADAVGLIGNELEQAARDFIGTELWQYLDDNNRAVIRYNIGLQKVTSSLYELSEGFKSDIWDAENPFASQLDKVKHSVEELLKQWGLTAEDESIQTWLKSVYDGAAKIDALTAKKTVSGWLQDISDTTSDLLSKLNGTFDPRSNFVAEWFRQNREEIEKIKRIYGDEAGPILDDIANKLREQFDADRKLKATRDLQKILGQLRIDAQNLINSDPFEVWKNSLLEFDEELGVFKMPDWANAETLQKVFDMTQKLEKIRELAGGIRDVLIDAFDDAYENGFKTFFDSVISGFNKMLYDMAVQWVTSKLYSMIVNLAISAIGGVSSGDGGSGGEVNSADYPTGTFAAFGANYISAGTPVKVGEMGPERIIPKSPIAVLGGANYAGGGGGGETFIFQITTPDANSFVQSKHQVMTAAKSEIERAWRRR